MESPKLSTKRSSIFNKASAPSVAGADLGTSTSTTITQWFEGAAQYEPPFEDFYADDAIDDYYQAPRIPSLDWSRRSPTSAMPSSTHSVFSIMESIERQILAGLRTEYAREFFA